MRLTRDHWNQLAGGAIGLLIAYGGIALGVAMVGPAGKAVLVASVPFGVITGVLVVHLLEFAQRVLADTDEK